ncbi:PucR family transcriptional regulator [Streptomyces adustus]|uniref:PucR family transcriptional regulator n=1 Tax=Streptomyces adustus TaxID=1609272 RepID=A0A5N8VKY7_9ACTN|nr:PucR family transcriptional regulator [Streptomyces adustus]MPY35392.1 PucR family transcriptional regulator [Streptomyces adustus]
MTVVHGPEPVAAILRAMAADTDVCGELVRAARTRSPALARLAEAETRSHVTAMVRAAGSWFTALDRAEAARALDPAGTPGPVTANETVDDVGSVGTFEGVESVEAQDFSAALLLGADRAGQGVPVTAVLRGVQAALTRAVEITVDRCRSAGVSDGTLLTVVLRLKEYGDALERHVVHGYRAAEGAAPDGADASRARLLRQLLVGGIVPDAQDLARAGARPNAEGLLHCFVAAPAHPHTLRFPHAVTARLDGHLAGLGPRPPTAGECPPGGLVVVAPAAPPAGLSALYRLCVRAVDLAGRRGRHGLYELTDFAAELALAEQPLLGAELSRRLLGALDPEDGFHRQLARTALTFLDCGRRLDQTAAALFTHPNTVRYRLGRLQQITGGSLADLPPAGGSGPVHALHWWWALTTWLGADGAPPERP